jgi:predicted phosphate transport protein (TIGR00153 family)
MRFLLPKQPAFFEHFKQLNTCIKRIMQILSEFSVSFKDFESYYVRAKEVEHQGDDITHEIVDMLNKTFITPFDREDLFALAQGMDDIIDVVEKTFQNIYIYQILEKKPVIDEFVNIAVKASYALDELIIECFDKQKHTSEVASLTVKIHELEDEGDLLFQKSIRQLFSDEKDPVLIIKWKDVIRNLEDIMDNFQSVSDTLAGIMVKFS